MTDEEYWAVGAILIQEVDTQFVFGPFTPNQSYESTSKGDLWLVADTHTLTKDCFTVKIIHMSGRSLWINSRTLPQYFKVE